MSDGKIGKEGRRISIFQRIFLLTKQGFTLVEVLLTCSLLAMVLAGLYLALSSEQFSSLVSSTKLDLQAQVRNTMDYIVQDARQTVSWEIADSSVNYPNATHIRFRKVIGWNITSGQNGTYLLSDNNYTEYTYNPALKRITRHMTDSNNAQIGNQVWTFYNITQQPFCTRDSSGSEIALNATELRTSGKLIIKIAGRKEAKRGLNVTSNLTEEIKIRNE